MDERHPDPKNETSEYEARFDRVSRRGVELAVGALLKIDRTMTLLGELLARPAAERLELAEREVRFHDLVLCELLFIKSQDTWLDDPAHAVELAEIAVVVADRLDTTRYGKTKVKDTQARARAHLGRSPRTIAGRKRPSTKLKSFLGRARMLPALRFRLRSSCRATD